MHGLKESLLFLLVFFIVIGCEKSDELDPEPDPIKSMINLPEDDGYNLLSEYNFFEGDLKGLNPNTEAGVLPYDLNMALFSDYALKKRFVYVPEGQSISFDTTAVLDFPVGSILIKHFYYTAPNGPNNNIETRLLIKRSDGWQPEIYEWNDTQTDALRTVIGGVRSLDAQVNGEAQSFNYLIPNQNQCKNCHANDGEIDVIGPSIQNLNKSYTYASGAANQLDKWIINGILDNPSFSQIPKWYGIDDEDGSLDERARAYLAVNCSSCHRLEGSAANSGFYLEYENTDSLSLGIWKTPIAAGAGSGGLTYVIHPGEGDESILLYRMISDEVEGRMPEIGRELLHDQGIELIRSWIDNL